MFAFSFSIFARAEEWSPYSTGPIITWVAPIAGEKQFVPHILGYYSNLRGVYDINGGLSLTPSDVQYTTYTEQLFFQYGFYKNWEVSVMAFYNEASGKVGDATANSNGLADTLLFLRYQVTGEHGWTPCITYMGVLKAPTGKYQGLDPGKLGTDLMGVGAWVPGFGVVITKKIKPCIAHMDTILFYPEQTTIDNMTTQYGITGNLDLAVEWFLLAGFNCMFELNGVMQGPKKVQDVNVDNSQSQSVMFTPSIGWSNEHIQTLFGYERNLCGVNAPAIDSWVIHTMFLF